MTRIAAATYPLDWFADWDAYEAKMRHWVSDAAGNGAHFLLFPEYGAMELASLSGIDPADLDAATTAAGDNLARSVEILSGLAQEFGVYIVAPSGPTVEAGQMINRAYFLTPHGAVEYQDKLIMTPWERDPWGVAGRGPMRIFDTDHGRVAILVCYDCEFPLLARQVTEAGADLILIPSATETVAGYHRVRIGAMARALEGQCFTAMSSITGPYPIDAVNVSHGAGGIFCPPDIGLPPTGVIAAGELDVSGWVYGDIDPAALAKIRAGGGVRNRADWDEQDLHTVELVTG